MAQRTRQRAVCCCDVNTPPCRVCRRQNADGGVPDEREWNVVLRRTRRGSGVGSRRKLQRGHHGQGCRKPGGLLRGDLHGQRGHDQGRSAGLPHRRDRTGPRRGQAVCAGRRPGDRGERHGHHRPGDTAVPDRRRRVRNPAEAGSRRRLAMRVSHRIPIRPPDSRERPQPSGGGSQGPGTAALPLRGAGRRGNALRPERGHLLEGPLPPVLHLPGHAPRQESRPLGSRVQHRPVPLGSPSHGPARRHVQRQLLHQSRRRADDLLPPEGRGKRHGGGPGRRPQRVEEARNDHAEDRGRRRTPRQVQVMGSVRLAGRRHLLRDLRRRASGSREVPYPRRRVALRGGSVRAWGRGRIPRRGRVVRRSVRLGRQGRSAVH